MEEKTRYVIKVTSGAPILVPDAVNIWPMQVMEGPKQSNPILSAVISLVNKEDTLAAFKKFRYNTYLYWFDPTGVPLAMRVVAIAPIQEEEDNGRVVVWLLNKSS